MNLGAALKTVGKEFYGEFGEWAYERFDYHNATYFDNNLKYPMIRFEIIPYGVGIGLCGKTLTGEAIISIAPHVLKGYGYRIHNTPIDSVPPGRVNVVDDILLHELMHQSVNETCQRLGEPQPKESHNNQHWLDLCNRIAPLLGFDDYKAGKYQTRRIPVADGGGTCKDTPKDCVAYEEIYGFPLPTYQRLGSNRYENSGINVNADFTI